MPAELKKVKDEEARVEAEEAAKRALEEYEVTSCILIDHALFFGIQTLGFFHQADYYVATNAS